MSKKIVILISAIVLFVIIVACVVGSVIISLKNASTAEQYDISGFNISAITKIVGERKVSSMKSSVQNNISTKSYTYECPENPLYDLECYLNYLAENEEFILDKNEGNNQTGGKVTAHKIADDNHTIIMEVYYDMSGYTIKITVKSI